MKKTVIPNLLVVISVIIFLFASAFALNPELENEVMTFEKEVVEFMISAACQTCNFGASGPPSGTCVEAQYCGMDGFCFDGPHCTLTGGLCGECVNDPGDGPGLIHDPGTP